MLLFVYGSLMKNFWNDCYLSNAIFIGEFKTIKKYSLYVEDKKIPYLSRTNRIYQVLGELYDVSEEDIKMIDDHEGNGAWYFRQQLKVTNDKGDEYTAYSYFNSNGDGELSNTGDFKEYMKN